MRASHRLAVIRRTIPFLAAFVGLLALAAAVIVQLNADQRARDLGTQIADLKTTITALTTRADALAKAQDNGTAEGLLALQDRMQKLEKVADDSATRLAAADLRPGTPATPAVAPLAASPQPTAPTAAAVPEMQVAEADAAPPPDDQDAVAANFADAENIAIRESVAGTATPDPPATDDKPAAPAAAAPAQPVKADDAAATEAAPASTPAVPAASAPLPAPSQLAYAPPPAQPKPAKIDPSLPTTDCIPLGTRFMATPNESYPMCQSKTVVKIGAILDGMVDIAGAGTVTQAGFGHIAGSDCTVSVYTADPAGFADLRVTCG